jgi:pSer/pThr/pTyr-binding forkhead associated (FHA) protein
MSIDDPQKKKTDDLSKTEYGKTWAMLEDNSISQALSEILRAAIEDNVEPQLQGVLFYIPNQSKPIIITDIDDVIRIGRADRSSNIIPDFDLGPYHGAELGVSRYHAEIVFTDGKYFLKDMGSRNGTWINGTKIQPYRQISLTDGDQIRFGHFTVLVKFHFE